MHLKHCQVSFFCRMKLALNACKQRTQYLNICRFNSTTVTKISYFVLAPSKECSIRNEVAVNLNSVAVAKISNIMIVSSKEVIDVLTISE